MNNTNEESKEMNSAFPLIGKPAPNFIASTTNGQIHFPADYKGKWVILFSHPADFTPVCTTEFMTFASMQEEFQSLGTELIGLSVDSIHSHLGWIRAMRNYEWNGIQHPVVKFPIIDDVKMEVSRRYGMIQGESDTAAVRAVFFIDPDGIMRTILYYPAALGRNFTEIKRILLGLQKADTDKVALPADWQPGKDVILPPPVENSQIDPRIEQGRNTEQYTQLDWYLTFKKDR